MEKDKTMKIKVSAQSVYNRGRQRGKSEPVSCSKHADRNTDADALEQMRELKEEFQQVKKNPAQLRQRVTDSEYWCAVCFQTYEQLMVFLGEITVPVFENKYIDGQLLAQKMGIELPPGKVRFRLPGYIDKDFQELAEKEK
ncbi:hypothetical protein [Snodgrassella sp. M0351]|uniref:hypothetical protein n=1 Tax=Snodgrassella sp. M0351 TaxID=2751012 RepID=UPI0018DC3ED9|nr:MULTISPECIES: hypothetical protein [Snodgrassella]MBI0165428.1 hypothetical protein [Snodgrassella sp. M0351]